MEFLFLKNHNSMKNNQLNTLEWNTNFARYTLSLLHLFIDLFGRLYIAVREINFISLKIIINKRHYKCRQLFSIFFYNLLRLNTFFMDTFRIWDLNWQSAIGSL